MRPRTERISMAAGAVACLLATQLLVSARPQDSQPSAENGRPPGAGALRALILAGGNTPEARARAAWLREVLENTGRFDVTVNETATGASERVLSGFDLVVNDHQAGTPGDGLQKTLDGFVAAGKGLVVTHAAESHGRAQGPHPGAGFYEIRPARTDHAVVIGLEPAARVADAVGDLAPVPPGAVVLATAARETDGGGHGPAQPAVYVHEHGKGRVFASALGHDVAALREPLFVTTFARGAEWAATGRVTFPADLVPPGIQLGPTSVRALLITGGHDHEASFYSLFEGYPDLAGIPVAPSTTAFQNDIREKYDVVIMYDFSRDLDETGRRNLRAFVAVGKGIVVLHHALLDYQEWPWWYEEVVGGRYRLKSENGNPSSSVKNNEAFFVTPAEHPVTAGVEPFHVVDETYKNMYISEKVKPLLTTDNPNSDRLVGWVGPCTTARVVAIQLGHGPTIFAHPGYRRLVHNAILWAAGRGGDASNSKSDSNGH